MRRIMLLVALVFVIGGGAVYTAAQTGTGSRTEEADVGADSAGCAAPMGSPDAEEITELLATSAASPEVFDDLATAIASPDATPILIDPCVTPDMGTPAS